MVLRRRAINIARVHHQKEKHNHTHAGDYQSGHNERPAPRTSCPDSGYDGPEDVPDRRVSVPESHDQAPVALSQPVGCHSHHTRPSGRLDHPTEQLGNNEVPVHVNPEEIGQPEHWSESTAQHHARKQKVAKVHSVADLTAEEHGDRIR